MPNRTKRRIKNAIVCTSFGFLFPFDLVTAGEFDAYNLDIQLQAKIESSIIELVHSKQTDPPSTNPKEIATEQTQLRLFAIKVRIAAISCFREESRWASMSDLVLFKTLLVRQENIFMLPDWGDRLFPEIEKHYGIKKDDWRCEQGKPTTSRECKPAQTYIAVGLKLYPQLAGCTMNAMSGN